MKPQSRLQLPSERIEQIAQERGFGRFDAMCAYLDEQATREELATNPPPVEGNSERYPILAATVDRLEEERDTLKVRLENAEASRAHYFDQSVERGVALSDAEARIQQLEFDLSEARAALTQYRDDAVRDKLQIVCDHGGITRLKSELADEKAAHELTKQRRDIDVSAVAEAGDRDLRREKAAHEVTRRENAILRDGIVATRGEVDTVKEAYHSSLYELRKRDAVVEAARDVAAEDHDGFVYERLREALSTLDALSQPEGASEPVDLMGAKPEAASEARAIVVGSTWRMNTNGVVVTVTKIEGGTVEADGANVSPFCRSSISGHHLHFTHISDPPAPAGETHATSERDAPR